MCLIMNSQLPLHLMVALRKRNTFTFIMALYPYQPRALPFHNQAEDDQGDLATEPNRNHIKFCACAVEDKQSWQRKMNFHIL